MSLGALLFFGGGERAKASEAGGMWAVCASRMGGDFRFQAQKQGLEAQSGTNFPDITKEMSERPISVSWYPPSLAPFPPS